ncbi:MAG TPA: GNAT family N-acetyltransferase [Ruminococcus flavefaciens]|nr:GNAT family N-acetyltransferase [Ruminococcus flavefaciens]
MIKAVTDNKEQYMDLLLIGDEQEDMVRRYLDRGDLFVWEENSEAVAVCVITREGDGVCELKNIAVSPGYQRKGIGRKMLRFAEEYCRSFADKLILGTGDSPLTVPFYVKCGYSRAHTVKNFFVDNYDHPIFEGGVRLVDMIYFEKELR